MNPFIAATLIMGCVATAASAQTQPPQPPSAPSPAAPAAPAPAPPAAAPPSAANSRVVRAAELEAGANSFTEGQARSRFEDAGFTNLRDLTKDDAGFWRGRGTRDGADLDLAMDFRGRIAAGPDVASLRAPAATPSGTAPPASSR